MQLFYLYNLRHIKAVAEELGISRKTFYERVNKFRQQQAVSSLFELACSLGECKKA